MNNTSKRLPSDRDFKKFMDQIRLEEKNRLHNWRPGFSMIVKLGLPVLVALAVVWTYLHRSGSSRILWDWCMALVQKIQ